MRHIGEISDVWCMQKRYEGSICDVTRCACKVCSEYVCREKGWWVVGGGCVVGRGWQMDIGVEVNIKGVGVRSLVVGRITGKSLGVDG